MTGPRGSRRLGRSHTELLLAAAHEDDREAFGELVGQLTGRLYRDAHGMVAPGSCDDLVQETWERAWKYRRGYRGAAQPHTWLYAIMYRVAAQVRSSDGAGTSVSSDEARDDSDADFEAVLVAMCLDAALGRLGDREADVIRRRDLQRQDWRTICREMEFTNRSEAAKVYEVAKFRLAAHYRPRRPGPDAR